MQYIISFLEGMITFISPCLLPMLPVYISYFAGGKERKAGKTLSCAFGFVLGFTVVFVLLGALAGSLGGLLREYKTAVNLISGAIVVLFGLDFIGVLRLNIFKGGSHRVNTDNMSFFSAMLFGMVFSIGWTPCVGAFLGSALMLASQRGHAIEGMLMLLMYSLGLGIPFIISALLIDQLKSTFDLIKRNYRVINLVCGSLLIVTGVLMMFGLFERLLSLLS
ncbi:MAG: sulfite exporter TauE/SafE family protein [Oscillospiraceae bacterium]|nr:sulfite exporter TauE/SafE family protein [Oscillospiraceae bacterium]